MFLGKSFCTRNQTRLRDCNPLRQTIINDWAHKRVYETEAMRLLLQKVLSLTGSGLQCDKVETVLSSGLEARLLETQSWLYTKYRIEYLGISLLTFNHSIVLTPMKCLS